MKPSRFAYARPTAVAEASALLADEARGTVVAIAGGQSLMPLLSLRVAPADLLVDLNHLPDLKSVRDGETSVRIGSGVTHAMFEDGAVPDPSGGLMRRVARGIAYRAVRNHGTIGGSVALADPAADWPVCLLALGATAQIMGPAGERSVALDDLLVGAYTTSLAPGEIITAFDVPKLAETARTGHNKVVRKSGAFAISIGCVVRDPARDTLRVVLGGTTTRAVLLRRVMDALASRTSLDEGAIRQAMIADLAEMEPDADDYMRRVHTATVLRAIREAM